MKINKTPDWFLLDRMGELEKVQFYFLFRNLCTLYQGLNECQALGKWLKTKLPDWFYHWEETLLHKEVQLESFCLPMKTNLADLHVVSTWRQPPGSTIFLKKIPIWKPQCSKMGEVSKIVQHLSKITPSPHQKQVGYQKGDNNLKQTCLWGKSNSWYTTLTTILCKAEIACIAHFMGKGGIFRA